jgi:hypothetical protein
MQRTPAQSAERRDPSAEQRRHSQEPVVPSAEFMAEFRRESELRQEKGEAVRRIIKAKKRAFIHLKTQNEALQKTVEKGMESSIRRQVDFFTSAFKDYNCIVEKAVKDAGLEFEIFDASHGKDLTYLEYFLTEGSGLYNETMSLVDEFF